VKNLKHKKNKELKSSYKEQDKSLHNYDNCNNFYLYIGRAFIEADRPLFELRHPSIKRFLEYYMQKMILCGSTVRKNKIGFWSTPFITNCVVEVVSSIRT
jgi:hypothetical protein